MTDPSCLNFTCFLQFSQHCNPTPGLEFLLAHFTSWTQIVELNGKNRSGRPRKTPECQGIIYPVIFPPFALPKFHEISSKFIKFHHSIQPPGTPSLQLNPDPLHASDCCLKFFSGPCALVVLVILLQVVNHCLRIAPPVSENISPGVRFKYSMSGVQRQ